MLRLQDNFPVQHTVPLTPSRFLIHCNPFASVITFINSSLCSFSQLAKRALSARYFSTHWTVQAGCKQAYGLSISVQQAKGAVQPQQKHSTTLSSGLFMGKDEIQLLNCPLGGCRARCVVKGAYSERMFCWRAWCQGNIMGILSREYYQHFGTALKDHS